MNNRGRIRPEVAERIRKIAQEMGYQPSLAGRALVMAGKKLKIGVILQSSETPFMQQVLQGIQAAKQEVEALGVNVDIHEVEGVNAGAVIALMRKMIEEVGGDNIACVSMFGFPEKMNKQAPEARARIERELLGK